MKKRLRKIVNSIIALVFLSNANIHVSGINADNLSVFGPKNRLESQNLPEREHLAPYSQIANGTIHEFFKAKEFLLAHKGTNAYLEDQIEKEIKVLGRDWWLENRVEPIDITLKENIGEIKYNIDGLKYIKLVKVTTLLNRLHRANLVSVNPEGLLACTGQFAHVGLSGKHYNNKPVIYMDTEFFGHRHGDIIL
ncbi:MAG: hypothetical protein KJ983_04340, partial [Candidatus Omnitrophica bacterium]|nr:hypothetical protein [Candidatus Omnitrophota bacterium]